MTVQTTPRYLPRARITIVFRALALGLLIAACPLGVRGPAEPAAFPGLPGAGFGVPAALAAEAAPEVVHGMKATHAVVLIDAPNPEALAKGDTIRIAGLGCHLNSDEPQHEEGFLHQATVLWAGTVPPGGFGLIVKVAPCEAKIPGWAVQETFVLERLSEHTFYATGYAIETGTLQMHPTGERPSFAWRENAHGTDPATADTVVCRHLLLAGPRSLVGAAISYTREEFAALGGVCPAYGFPQSLGQAGR